ncbi:putative helicase mov-10-B.1-like protein [Fimicolochytrium jonesii]|uniref:putative helicase mov-10-B.1-like protein n=1 Tax=Fimicolochytrium jonesii TaxID=1396493 RepID=UPI0022FDFF3F|nr:putative helicase mov-10-B.1-like protein [Fimicolochytrium jonesii]KAI8821341.1 putative helicase mov-10-B.1-like protein [Fimicolochytrium jonesii]
MVAYSLDREVERSYHAPLTLAFTGYAKAEAPPNRRNTNDTTDAGRSSRRERPSTNDVGAERLQPRRFHPRREQTTRNGDNSLTYGAQRRNFLLDFVRYVADQTDLPKTWDEFRELYSLFRASDVSAPVGLAPASASAWMHREDIMHRVAGNHVIFTTRLEEFRGTAHTGRPRGMASALILAGNREYLARNKKGIIVDDLQRRILNANPDFNMDEDGFIRIPVSKTKTRVQFYVNNHGNETWHLARPPYLGAGNPAVSIIGRRGESSRTEVELEPDNAQFYELMVNPKHHGYVRLYVIFFFREDFVICRYISLKFEDAEIAKDVAEMKPVAPYVKKPRKRISELMSVRTNIVRGVAPRKFDPGRFPVKLPQYNIPQAVLDMAETNACRNQNVTLMPDNHQNTFSLLLHLEEIQMWSDIRQYDMKNAQLQQVGSYLTLEVPGLAEKRPSVLYGDKIYVRLAGQSVAREYEGYVWRVQKEEVYLKFSPTFVNNIWIAGMLLDVRFTFCRTPLRRQHLAISKLNDVSPELRFPEVAPSAPLTLKAISQVNTRLNAEQMQAVKYVANHANQGVPYLIWGPPGTGKTSVLVEAIIQTARLNPRARILAMAPSNSAADQIVERLDKIFRPSEMYRLNAYKRSKEDVSAVAMEYSTYNEKDGVFELPEPKFIEAKRVVVCTLISAGYLVALGIPRGHFTKWFVDEAGQATEPEFWIGLSGLIDTKNPTSQLCIAGDPKQLGPILRSRDAIQLGLAKSFLERLTECPLYQSDKERNATPSGYNPHVVTMLTRNYRSHPAIIDLPSKRFYNGILEASADVLERESLCKWEGLPTKGFPIMFHAVQGKDEREGDSPSWFNRDEAAIVAKYISKLRDARGGLGIDTSQIGVIAPYRKQVQRIRALLKGKGHIGVKTVAVEEFQGQERRIIIISTVRSTLDFVDHDTKFNLGFLRNPKRFNVAITRAKALLIIIGNPVVLQDDPNWAALINFCRDNTAVCGDDPGPRAGTRPPSPGEMRSRTVSNEESADVFDDPEWNWVD